MSHSATNVKLCRLHLRAPNWCRYLAVRSRMNVPSARNAHNAADVIQPSSFVQVRVHAPTGAHVCV